MMAEPKSYRCTILIEQISPDPDTPDKHLLSGKILTAEETAKDNTFFAEGRSIRGYTFNRVADVKPGMKVRADVEFMGNPFIQNYHLRNLEVIP